jgi:hypothetical protein
LAGGKVVLSGGTLTINNGAGDDFAIQGTYERTSSTTTMSIISGANVICADGGTYIHNVAGGSLPIITWQDGSLLNIKNSINSGNSLVQSFWNVLKEGGNATTLSADNTSRTMTVRKNFEHTGGVFYLKNGGLSGGTHTLRVHGNIIHSGGVFGWNSNTSDNTSTTNIFIEGNFTITATAEWGGYVSATQCASGIFFDGSGHQTFSSNLAFSAGAGRDRFYYRTTGGPTALSEIYTGDTEQWTINGACGASPPSGFSRWPTSGTILQNITINNTSAAGVNLRDSRTVNGSLVLTSGRLNTGNCNAGTTSATLLTLADNATTSGASSASYVNGVMRKVGNDAFMFPVGDGNAYAPIGISAPANSTDEFGACYTTGSPRIAFGETYPVGLDHVSDCEYWHLNRITGSSSVSAVLTWDTRSCGVTDLSELRVARFDGSAWADHGNTATSGTTASGAITSGSISSFSPFTLGSSTSNNPLPVELTSFVANCTDFGVELSWTTGSEYNASHFIIEKSSDGHSWNTIAHIDASGTTNQTSHYTYIDRQKSNLSYYRLVQFDFDGTHEAFGPISSQCNYSQNSISAYPNPTDANIFISIHAVDFIQDAKIELIDISGRIIEIRKIEINSGTTVVNFNLEMLPPGTYLVRVIGNNHEFVPLKISRI